MNVTLSKNIVEYANKKGRAGLQIKLLVTGCCCGSAVTHDTRFITSDRLEKLRERGFREFDVDGLKVMIDPAIHIKDDVQIEMARPLGVRTFSVVGIELPGDRCRVCAPDRGA